MPRNEGRAAAVCLLLVAAIACAHALAWTLDPSLTAGNNGNDLIFLADGTRHLAAGQWPHSDLSLPVGVLSYLLYWTGEIVLPGMPAYMALHLLAFVLLAPLLVAAAVQMPNWWLRLLIIGVAAIMALLPFNTADFGICGNDFYASYNRFGAALSFAYLAWVFRAGKHPLLDSALLAGAILTAFFLKIVYLAVILGPLAVFILFDARWRRIALYAFAAVAVALGLVEIGTGTVSAYLGDLRAMSAINGGQAPYFVFSFVYKQIAGAALAGALVLCLLAAAWRNRRAGFAATLATLRTPLALGAALAGIVVAESQSTGGMGLTAVLALLTVPEVLAPSAPKAVRVLALALATLLASTLAVNAFQKGMCNLLDRQGEPQKLGWATRFDPHLAVPASMAEAAESLARLWEEAPADLRPAEWSLLFAPDQTGSLTYLAQWVTVDHAIRALDAEGGPAQLGRTTTLSFVDMFGYALRAAPPKGMKNVIDIDRTMMPPDAAGAAAYLTDVDSVFVPACGLVEPLQHDPGAPPLSAAYAGVLRADFTATPLTPCWTLYRRIGRR